MAAVVAGDDDLENLGKCAARTLGHRRYRIWGILSDSQESVTNSGLEVSVRDLTLLLVSYDGEQSTLVLDHFPFTVGKGSDCDLVFIDRRVSRHHATFTREGDDVYIVDERSRRGTFVNGEPIDRCKLKRGDKIEFEAQGVEWVLFDPERLP